MNEEEEETNSLRELIQNLTANMESNFAKLHEEFNPCEITLGIPRKKFPGIPRNLRCEFSR